MEKIFGLRPPTFSNYSGCGSKHSDWVKVGPYYVGAMSLDGKKLKADLYVFLDSSYLKKGDILVGFRSRLGRLPAIYVNWPDQGTIPQPEYKALISYVLSQLKKGKKVAVGCFGGHGRTGTMLAGLIKVVECNDGVKEVRTRYCPKAVETKAQEQMVNNIGR